MGLNMTVNLPFIHFCLIYTRGSATVHFYLNFYVVEHTPLHTRIFRSVKQPVALLQDNHKICSHCRHQVAQAVVYGHTMWHITLSNPIDWHPTCLYEQMCWRISNGDWNEIVMKCCPSLNLQILINYFCYRQTLISLVINARSSTVLLRNKVLYCLRSSKVVPQGQQSKHHLYHGQYMPEGIFFFTGAKGEPTWD